MKPSGIRYPYKALNTFTMMSLTFMIFYLAELFLLLSTIMNLVALTSN